MAEMNQTPTSTESTSTPNPAQNQATPDVIHYDVGDFMSGKVDQDSFLRNLYGDEPQPQEGNNEVVNEQENAQQPNTGKPEQDPNMELFQTNGKLDFEKLNKFFATPNQTNQTNFKQEMPNIQQQPQQALPVQEPIQPQQPVNQIDQAKNTLNQVFDLALQYQQRFNIPIEQAKEMALERITESLTEHERFKSFEDKYKSIEEKLKALENRPDATTLIQKYNDNLSALSKEHGFNSPRDLESTIINYGAQDLCSMFDSMNPDKKDLPADQYNKEVYKFLQTGLSKNQLNSLVKVAKADIIHKSWNKIQEQLQIQMQQQQKNNQSVNTQTSNAPLGYEPKQSEYDDPMFNQMKRIFPDAFK